MIERYCRRVIAVNPFERRCGEARPCSVHDVPVSMESLDWKYGPLALPPPPTILELLGRFGLTHAERRRVFDGHDAGDEDAGTRRGPTWVCGRRRREFTEPGRHPACELAPNHIGPCDWMTYPAPTEIRVTYSPRVVVDGGEDPGDL